MLNPTSGSIGVQQDVGLLIQGVSMYEEASGLENLKIFCQESHTSTEHIAYVLSLVNIDPHQARMKYKNCSQGYKQRLQIARSLLRCQGLILLDEPFSALDFESVRIVSEGIRKLTTEKNVTVVISSHRLKDIQGLIDVALFINEGKILAHMQADASEKYLSIICKEPQKLADNLRDTMPEVLSETFKTAVLLKSESSLDHNKILEALSLMQIEWTKIERYNPLELAYDKFINNASGI